MKVFYVSYGFCLRDYTPLYSTAEEASKHFASNIHFVDAPNYVFEGWGYDETQKGRDRFIKPTPPEGWKYDDDTGAFVEINPKPVEIEENVTTNELEQAYQEGVNSI